MMLSSPTPIKPSSCFGNESPLHSQLQSPSKTARAAATQAAAARSPCGSMFSPSSPLKRSSGKYAPVVTPVVTSSPARSGALAKRKLGFAPATGRPVSAHDSMLQPALPGWLMAAGNSHQHPPHSAQAPAAGAMQLLMSMSPLHGLNAWWQQQAASACKTNREHAEQAPQRHALASALFAIAEGVEAGHMSIDELAENGVLPAVAAIIAGQMSSGSTSRAKYGTGSVVNTEQGSNDADFSQADVQELVAVPFKDDDAAGQEFRCLALETLSCILTSDLTHHDSQLSETIIPSLVLILRQYMEHLEDQRQYMQAATQQATGMPNVACMEQQPPQLLMSSLSPSQAACTATPIYQDTASAPAWLRWAGSQGEASVQLQHMPMDQQDWRTGRAQHGTSDGTHATSPVPAVKAWAQPSQRQQQHAQGPLGGNPAQWTDQQDQRSQAAFSNGGLGLLKGITMLGSHRSPGDSSSVPAAAANLVPAMPGVQQQQQGQAAAQVQPPPTSQQQQEQRQQQQELWDNAGHHVSICLLRLSRLPACSHALVKGGAVPLLAQVLRLQPERTMQALLYALYKLANPTSKIDIVSSGAAARQLLQPCEQQQEVLLQLVHSGAVGDLCGCLMSRPKPDTTAEQAPSRLTQPERAPAVGLAKLAVTDSGAQPGCSGSGADSAAGPAPAASLSNAVSGKGQLSSAMLDLAGSLLVDMANVPGMPELFAAKGLIGPVVALLGASPGHQARLWALLTLGRLALHSPACQMDVVREGGLSSLVAMLGAPQLQDRAHAARLIGILAQSVPTHGLMSSQGALEGLVQVLRGYNEGCEQRAQKSSPNGSRVVPVQRASQEEAVLQLPWHRGSQAAAAASPKQLPREGSPQVALQAGSSMEAALQLPWKRQEQRSAARQLPEPKADKVSVPGSEDWEHAQTVAVHAAAALSVLAQNPDLHFDLVGGGAVPQLVKLLETGNPRAKASALACLMMITTQDARHAAVVVRANGIEALLGLLSSSGCSDQTEQGVEAAAAVPQAGSQGGADVAAGTGNGNDDRLGDFAAALMASLCRYQNIQMEFLEAGGLPHLLRLIAQLQPASEGIGHAAEALALLAAVPQHRPMLVLRRTDVVATAKRLMSEPLGPSCHYWGSMLLHLLSSEAGFMAEVLEQRLQEEVVCLLKAVHQPPGSTCTAGYGAGSGHGEGYAAGGSSTSSPSMAGPDVDRLQSGFDGQEEGCGSLDDAAWAAAQALDGALATVQAAWLAGQLGQTPTGAKALVAAGAVGPLVRLLGEAVSAAEGPAAAAEQGEGGGAVSLQHGTGAWQYKGLGTHWYKQIESQVMAGLADDQQEEAAQQLPGAAASSPGAAAAGPGSSLGQLLQPRPLGMQSSACAAAAAALMALARQGGEVEQAVAMELCFQVWQGRVVRFEGLKHVENDGQPE